MNKTIEALKLAEEAFNYRCTPMSNYSVQTSIDKEKKALAAIREALAEQEPKCSDHPDAPHGFNRNASHNADRYVCDCEGWEPEQQKQKPVAWYGMSKTGDILLSVNCVEENWIPLYAAPVSIEAAVQAEREACLACYSPDDTATDWADKIIARGEK